jgi:hypothetical protein
MPRLKRIIDDLADQASLSHVQHETVQDETRLISKAMRLAELVRRRDECFRRSVLADSLMGVMLSLFLAQLRQIGVNEATLALVNLIDRDTCAECIEQLILAGLVVVTGEKPGRRTVGLTPLGSARMRSYISDYPDL